MEIFCKIRLFGGVSVERRGELITKFRTHKAESLLAYLALNLRQTHSREQLIDRFWQDMEPEAARDNLSTVLSSLRKQLEPTGVPSGTVLLANRQSVRLDPATVTTDVSEFEGLLARAGKIEVPTGKIETLSQIAALYRSDFLPDSYEEWALEAQNRFRTLYTEAMVELAALYERTCDFSEGMKSVLRALETDPYHETAYQIQMRLYASMGQPARALDVFSRLETLLKAEFLASPALATIRLAQKIRTEPDGFLPASDSEIEPFLSPLVIAPASRTATGLLSEAAEEPPEDEEASNLSNRFNGVNLPVQLTRFIGRETELQTVCDLLADPETRLVTLTGSGGHGKSRLSTEIGRRSIELFRGNVRFVELANCLNPTMMLHTLSNSLELPNTPGMDVIQQISLRFERQPCLLILDNFEQLMREPGREISNDKRTPYESVALVRILLQRTPHLKCLVTSRSPLFMEGERRFALAPLCVPQEGESFEALLKNESVALYADRARSVKPDFALTPSNAQAIATLCRKLEGVPLSIEMTASRAKTLPAIRALERLDNQLDLLVSRRRDSVPRHQSLRATIQWSYELLSYSQRRLFETLSVFQRDWSSEAAEAIFKSVMTFSTGAEANENNAYPPDDDAPESLESADFEDVSEILEELESQSMIVIGGSETEPRWRMLETLREFSAEKLEASGGAKEAKRAHAHHFLEEAERGKPSHWTSHEKREMDRLTKDSDNLHAALEWFSADSAECAHALQMAITLSRFWEVRGHLRFGEERLVRILSLPEANDFPALKSEALHRAGVLTLLQTKYSECKAYENESVRIARLLKNDSLISSALHGLANAHFYEQEYDLAKETYEASLALRLELQDRRGLGASYHSLGNIAMRLENYEEAKELLEKALAIRRDLEERSAIANTLGALGQLARCEDDLDMAELRLREALEIFTEIDIPWAMSICINDFIMTSLQRGLHSRAATLSGANDSHRKRAQHPVPPRERESYQQRLNELKTALGDEEFDVCWSRGRAMSLEQALQYLAEQVGVAQ